jgi:putative addiction module component (TIGR02574 family)
MALTLQQITEQAMQLPAQSRVDLAEQLVESLSETELADVQKLWASEAIRRRDELRSGRVQAIPGEQVQAEVRRAIRR